MATAASIRSTSRCRFGGVWSVRSCATNSPKAMQRLSQSWPSPPQKPDFLPNWRARADGPSPRPCVDAEREDILELRPTNGRIENCVSASASTQFVAPGLFIADCGSLSPPARCAPHQSMPGRVDRYGPFAGHPPMADVCVQLRPQRQSRYLDPGRRWWGGVNSRPHSDDVARRHDWQAGLVSGMAAVLVFPFRAGRRGAVCGARSSGARNIRSPNFGLAPAVVTWT